MRLKLSRDLRPTKEQVLEIANIIMTPPKSGWKEYLESLDPESSKTNVYDVSFVCGNGEYISRINLSFNLITIFEIKEAL